MTPETAQILSHISNSGIVQMPGRKFPGIVMQGDSISDMFNAVAWILADAKSKRDEERYYELLMFAETLQGQRRHYEMTLTRLGMPLPYSPSIEARLVTDDCDDA